MAHTITIHQLCQALGIQEQSVRKREREGGLPAALSDATPRTYDLLDVLQMLDGNERADVATVLRLNLIIQVGRTGPKVEKSPRNTDDTLCY